MLGEKGECALACKPGAFGVIGAAMVATEAVPGRVDVNWYTGMNRFYLFHAFDRD